MIPIKSIMTTNVITVKPETPIIEAIRLLTEHKISGMPVVDDEMHVKGILSEKDVLEILIRRDVQFQETVGDYMTRKVISYSEDESAIAVCKFFLKSHFRRVPIVKDGKLIGIVSRRDLIALIVDAKNTIAGHRFD